MEWDREKGAGKAHGTMVQGPMGVAEMDLVGVDRWDQECVIPWGLRLMNAVLVAIMIPCGTMVHDVHLDSIGMKIICEETAIAILGVYIGMVDLVMADLVMADLVIKDCAVSDLGLGETTMAMEEGNIRKDRELAKGVPKGRIIERAFCEVKVHAVKVHAEKDHEQKDHVGKVLEQKDAVRVLAGKGEDKLLVVMADPAEKVHAEKVHAEKVHAEKAHAEKAHAKDNRFLDVSSNDCVEGQPIGLPFFVGGASGVTRSVID